MRTSEELGQVLADINADIAAARARANLVVPPVLTDLRAWHWQTFDVNEWDQGPDKRVAQCGQLQIPLLVRATGEVIRWPRPCESPRCELCAPRHVENTLEQLADRLARHPGLVWVGTKCSGRYATTPPQIADHRRRVAARTGQDVHYFAVRREPTTDRMPGVCGREGFSIPQSSGMTARVWVIATADLGGPGWSGGWASVPTAMRIAAIAMRLPGLASKGVSASRPRGRAWVNKRRPPGTGKTRSLSTPTAAKILNEAHRRLSRILNERYGIAISSQLTKPEDMSEQDFADLYGATVREVDAEDVEACRRAAAAALDVDAVVAPRIDRHAGGGR